ncbi:hypothetical protein GWE18_00195 [Bradyrhizobium sp. CSA112]|uniref:hypothetical protein n=1 Tax=Bradyrhizobium sp. CSA112 TaxID=2699170 RepID=UPI0023B13526|nr:hypothetical protein [Bradyrhizobium sp. CSA112]MDE5451296.1 hypothetical protein [Bradyrhizobium sp. CSA112]
MTEPHKCSPDTVEAIVLRAMKNKRDPEIYGTSHATVMNEDIAQKAARDIAVLNAQAATPPNCEDCDNRGCELFGCALSKGVDPAQRSPDLALVAVAKMAKAAAEMELGFAAAPDFSPREMLDAANAALSSVSSTEGKSHA